MEYDEIVITSFYFMYFFMHFYVYLIGQGGVLPFLMTIASQFGASPALIGLFISLKIVRPMYNFFLKINE